MRRLLSGQASYKDGSVGITDTRVINKFVEAPDFPWLISFPRTGSHWLRMVMELYFEKPSLVRIFYYKDANDFTCYHRHDEELKVEGIKNVIYLYRHPVETVYSQLNYYKEGNDDIERITHWSDLYSRHLSKWLFDEGFTMKKTVITYEGLKGDMYGEFGKVSRHFGQELDRARLEAALARVSKADLKKKTRYDGQIVNLTDTYQARREEFRKKHGGFVMDTVMSRDARLSDLFRG